MLSDITIANLKVSSIAIFFICMGKWLFCKFMEEIYNKKY